MPASLLKSLVFHFLRLRSQAALAVSMQYYIGNQEAEDRKVSAKDQLLEIEEGTLLCGVQRGDKTGFAR